MIQYQKLPLAFWKIPVCVIFVENIWIIMLNFSWDLWFCRCSPIWLLIVLFWDLTLCRLVNGYQRHSNTFQKIVHPSSVIETASWPVIVNSKHSETQGSIVPRSELCQHKLLVSVPVIQNCATGAHPEYFVGGWGWSQGYI